MSSNKVGVGSRTTLRMSVCFAVAVAAVLLTLTAAVEAKESICKRCANTFIIFVGTIYDCCNDTTRNDPGSCYYFGDNGWNVGARTNRCVFDDQGVCHPDDACEPENTRLQLGSPIIVALDGRRPRLSTPTDGAPLDIVGAGVVVRASVPVDAHARWLVLDLNRNGMIDGARELLGASTRPQSGGAATDGHAALTELDENRDGELTAADAVWKRMMLWNDRNRNGQSDPGELTTLEAARVVALSTMPVAEDRQDANGNRTFSSAGVRMAGRLRGRTYAVQPAHVELPGIRLLWSARACALN